MDEFINRLTVQEGIGGLMHPLMRLGISLYMKQPGGLEGTNYTSPQTFKELDMKINTRIMVETVVHKPAGEQLEKLRRSYPAGPEGEAQCQEALTRNKQSRKFVAKMLLMTQLSDFKRMEKAGGAIVPHDWDSHISAAYTHCSRVGFILPKEADSIRQQRMLDSFLGARDGLDAGFASRFSATHALKRKSAEPGGREFKEQKMKFGWYTGQSGMNIAVGGLGNTGIAGAPGEERLLRNDGSCGHLYMHLDKGNERYHTGLLLGFESDAFKKKNQLGHTHGLGNPEYASSFGGLRTDEIGEKYGGRQADLTKFSPEMLERIMDSFDAYLERELDAEDTGDLTELVKKLAGQKMNRENMQELFTKIQVLNPDDILSLIP